MPTITAAVMTKNEAMDIKDCLNSVAWANEIIVLDSGSTDGTQEICRQHGAEVIDTDWPGFGEQSNRCLEKSSSDWCLLLDADERVTPELKKEIIDVINSNNDYVIYKTPRLNFFLGKKIVHCLTPKGDQPTRLIKKNFGRFTGIVHPEISSNGKVGTLKNNLLHFPFHNLDEVLDKANSYSTLSAEKLFSQGKKSSIYKTLSHATWSFVKHYFFKCGFLDGWEGFLIAFGNFEGTFYRYAKLLEKSRDNKVLNK